MKLSGNADLVVSKGRRCPPSTSADYGSFNIGNARRKHLCADQFRAGAALARHWYLGVINRDSRPVSYTVLAKELDVTNSLTNSVNIITLTNGVPFN